MPWIPPLERAPAPPPAMPSTRASGGSKARRGGADAEAEFWSAADRWARAGQAVFTRVGVQVRFTGPKSCIPTGKGTVDASGAIPHGDGSIPVYLDVKSTTAPTWSANNSTLRDHEAAFLRAVAALPGCWAGVLVCLRRDSAPRWEMRRLLCDGRWTRQDLPTVADLPELIRAQVLAEEAPAPPTRHSETPGLRPTPRGLEAAKPKELLS